MKRRSIRSLLRAALLATIVVSVFALLVFQVPKLPFPKGTIKPLTIPPLNLEGTEGHFYSEPISGSLSQLALYHGVGGSIEHAKAADVLFMGNSRLQSGLRHHFAERAKAAGIKAFSIGAGYAERVPFAMEVIRKQRLTPKILVVMGGPYFYSDDLSNMAEQAMAMSWWAAFKRYWEERAYWVFQRHLHTHLPKLAVLDRPLTHRIINYRSIEHGWWKAVHEPTRPYAIRPGAELRDYGFVMPRIDDIMSEMSKHDTLVILSLLPYGRTMTGHFDLITQRYDIPVLLPSFEGLSTNDGSHLHPESAALYAERFWELFIANPRVRERLGLD